MELVIFFISIAFCICCYFVDKENKKQKKKQEEDRQKKEIQRLKTEKEKEEKLREWENTLAERAERYGQLTKQVRLGGNVKDDIYVYEASRIIYIKNTIYSFSDIITCAIDKTLHKKGTTTQTTTPDKFEMAKQEILYGQGKKYNVKSTTVINTTPDEYKYNLYIGVKSISNPQIEITFSHYQQSKANEIKNLIEAIIEISKDSKGV